jgi:HAMP domain-containing protein
MRLGPKITVSFTGFIVLFGAVSTVATSHILDARMKHELKTSEVAFARSLATRFFKSIKDKDKVTVTDALLDELALRPEKIGYLMVLDKDGGRVAHTFLAPIPSSLSALPTSYDQSKFRIDRIESPEVDVYDVSVPVLEGIAPVGSVHVGLRNDYLASIKRDLVRTTLLVTVGIGLVAFLVALLLTRRIVLPVRQLTAVANQLSAGQLDVTLPGLQTDDEIQELEASLAGVLAAVSTLMSELERQEASAVAASDRKETK